jgi:hypothetical protein
MADFFAQMFLFSGSDTIQATCQDNSRDELISIGCVPVTVSEKRNASPPPDVPICCDEVVSATDPAAADILAFLGIVLQDADVLVGLTCIDVTAIGNSATCGSVQTEVTCADNTHWPLISIGCVPVTL